MTFGAPPQLAASMSARSALNKRTLAVVAVVVGVVGWSATQHPQVTVSVVMSGIAIAYLAFTVDRHWLIVSGLRRRLVEVSDDDALAVPDHELPCYTVLLPVYHEPQILQNLIDGVGQIVYPHDKLEILLLLEEDDDETLRALQKAEIDAVRVVIVPHSLPKTKPKACNYGMALPGLRGEYVTIYDAEDIPDPLQLRRAAVAFSRYDDDRVGCVQARLGFFNERQNLLTGWFALEYQQWFGMVLPAVEAANCVVPLGGTSNHIPTAVWREVGGWDAYNVTEDADIGVRLARHGYRTVILDSITLEEANSDVVNWIRQRSRWYKGYLQTMIVHLRNPLTLVRQIGLVATLRFIGMTGGIPLANTLNLAFFAIMLAWFAGRPFTINEMFSPHVYFVYLGLFVIAGPLSVFINLIVALSIGKPHLTMAALLSPLYWILQSVAAVKSIYQLVFRPFFWEKTVHGLTWNPQQQGGQP